MIVVEKRKSFFVQRQTIRKTLYLHSDANRREKKRKLKVFLLVKFPNHLFADWMLIQLFDPN